LKQNLVRAGDYRSCLIHWLSIAPDGDFQINNKYDFTCWLQSLAPECADALEMAARRIVRGFDEAHTGDGLTLDAPKTQYERKYPFCYRLSKRQALAFIQAELARRNKATDVKVVLRPTAPPKQPIEMTCCG